MNEPQLFFTDLLRVRTPKLPLSLLHLIFVVEVARYMMDENKNLKKCLVGASTTPFCALKESKADFDTLQCIAVLVGMVPAYLCVLPVAAVFFSANFQTFIFLETATVRQRGAA